MLAARTATTFTYPATRAQASREIGRLRGLQAEPALPGRRLEPVHYATAVAAEEVEGYGSSATWRVSAPPRRPARSPGRAGPLELARYTVAGEERVLALEQSRGTAAIEDRPAAGGGRVYVVERDVQGEPRSSLQALLVEYVSQARRLEEVPMACAAVREILGALDGDA